MVSQTKRNNDKKIKQTDKHNKSEKSYKSEKAVQIGKVPAVYGGKDL